MKTSTKDFFINKKPSSNINSISNEMNYQFENIPKSTVTTMSTISKIPQKEEDEFWKDCIEEPNNQSKYQIN